MDERADDFDLVLMDEGEELNDDLLESFIRNGLEEKLPESTTKPAKVVPQSSFEGQNEGIVRMVQNASNVLAKRDF